MSRTPDTKVRQFLSAAGKKLTAFLREYRNPLVVLLLFSLFFSACLMISQPERVITLGIFAGSSWDVPGSSVYQIIDTAIERFEKEHPSFRVEYESGILKNDYTEWLSGKILQGRIPDVFMVLDSDFSALADLGALRSLDSLMENDPDFQAEAFFPGPLQSGQWNGTQYAIPYESNPQLMFVNRTLLESCGIGVPAGRWSLEELVRIVEKVTQDTDQDGKLDQYGIYNYSWQNAAAASGLEIFSSDGTKANLLDGKLADAISLANELSSIQNNDLITQEDFDEGRVAFSPMSYAEYRTYKPYPWKVKRFSQFDWTCIPMPTADGVVSGASMDSLLLAISPDTSFVSQSWDLVRLLTCDEEIQTLLFDLSQGLPSARSVLQRAEQSQKADSAEPYPSSDGMEEMDTLNYFMVENTMENAHVISKFPRYEELMDRLDIRIRSDASSYGDLDLFLVDLNKEINDAL